MKILLAPNAFKGCLSAQEFCSRASFLAEHHQVKCLPFSDGGDSILEVFSSAFPSAKIYYARVFNAIGKEHKAPYLILEDGKTCIIESAKICGLGELKKSELDILNASSFGIGQTIKAAYKKGARVFYIGLGGVAFNDGGAGMAMALGYKFFASDGKKLKKGAAVLRGLCLITPPNILPDIKVYGLSDVDNILLGPKGSASVYGPQKGATPSQVKLVEEAMTDLHRAVKKYLGANINTKHCGAAGALGAGLKGFLKAKLVSGAPFIAAKLGLAKAVKQADVIITGEGKLDSQTFYGKGPFYICGLAAKYGKPVIFVCGINEVKDKNLLKKYSVVKMAELSALAGGREDSLKNAPIYIEKALRKIFDGKNGPRF